MANYASAAASAVLAALIASAYLAANPVVPNPTAAPATCVHHRHPLSHPNSHHNNHHHPSPNNPITVAIHASIVTCCGPPSVVLIKAAGHDTAHTVTGDRLDAAV